MYIFIVLPTVEDGGAFRDFTLQVSFLIILEVIIRGEKLYHAEEYVHPAHEHPCPFSHTCQERTVHLLTIQNDSQKPWSVLRPSLLYCDCPKWKKIKITN